MKKITVRKAQQKITSNRNSASVKEHNSKAYLRQLLGATYLVINSLIMSIYGP